MWQQRTHVPKFGNWENEENVPYTAYFDKARKGRTGTKMINPNDPEENPDILSDYSTSADTSLANQKADGGPKPAEHGAVRPAHESRRSKEDNDLKFANSPVNNHNNLGRRPSSELANQRHGSAGRGAPDHGAAVPKFGEWDETNPASADGFTHIFNKVREERQIGPGRVGTPEPSYPHTRKPVPDDSAKGCCFPWCRK
ncbi:hypothetical protein TIFTF001_019450 [Ficus carica]|uniref:RIN4 pathogenic type III effector avirulence factor Avr cleavage site domain-containing protein n=1 Tax=Ficus carica TaxID=3494 RepID=A0AA88D8X3_FICCA|nr:hypothetical protein TIFTF001_019450 [Ficus carica]